MSIKFTGDTPHNAERILTGWYTLDKALGDHLGNRGWPNGSLCEMYGPKGAGKTTISTWLAGKIAAATGNIIDYCDLEGQSDKTIMSILENAGFDDTLRWVGMRKGETPEAMIDRFIDQCFKDDAGIGIFDAIGAYTSGAEFKGKLTDKNVGEKPFVMGRVAGRLLRAVLTSTYSRTIFLLNHEHPTFGSLVRGGTATGGGEKKKYLSHERIRVQQAYLGTSVINFEKGYLIKGKVDNNRFGYDKGLFYGFIIKGQGIHIGLTAMWECIALKYASVSADAIREGTSVKMDGTNFGKIGDIIENRDKEPGFFLPFINSLAQHDTESNLEDPDEEEAE
jgi:RecA/RadA recombinase